MTTTDLIESFFPGSAFRTGLRDEPLKVDISETDNAYHIKADVPGIDKKGLEVQFHENVLTITASIKDEKKDDSGEDSGKGRVIHRERFTGKYERSFKFGKEIDPDSVKAKLKEGVLNITISKRDPEVARKERLIDID